MLGRLDLMFFVVIASSNGCVENGYKNNKINSNEIELLKADNAKLWKELKKTNELVQLLTENCHKSKTEVIGGKYFD